MHLQSAKIRLNLLPRRPNLDRVSALPNLLRRNSGSDDDGRGTIEPVGEALGFDLVSSGAKRREGDWS